MAERTGRRGVRRGLAIAVGLIAIVAAAGLPFVSQMPSVEGAIGRVAETKAGARPAWILVEKTPGQPTGEKVMLTLHAAIVLAYRADPDSGRWRVGRRVKARYRDPALASYPTHADALIVELL